MIGNDYWRQMMIAKNLKIGDLIHTCNGYNERIADIEKEIWKKPNHKGYVVGNLSIRTDVGGYHSIQDCCTLPILSKNQILSYWKSFSKYQCYEYSFGAQTQKLLESVKNGNDPFDDNGCLLDEYRCTQAEYDKWKKQYDAEMLKEEILIEKDKEVY